MRFRGGEFSTGTMGNFQPELTNERIVHPSLAASRLALGQNEAGLQIASIRLGVVC
jgi:hypothetical protein